MIFLKINRLAKTFKRTFKIVLCLVIIAPFIANCNFAKAENYNQNYNKIEENKKLTDCFPDEAFAEYIYQNILYKSDFAINFKNYTLTPDDVNNIKQTAKIQICSNNKIEDLNGIQNFSSLLILDCSNTQIKSLDLSELTNLTELYCFNTPIETLDVSMLHELAFLNVAQCTNLKKLSCGGAKLDEQRAVNDYYIDISGSFNDECHTLDEYNIPFNPMLTSLDVSDCIKLENLDCSNTNLSFFDCSGCTSLRSLSCSHTDLTEIKLENLDNLNDFSCYLNNSLDTINIQNCNNLANVDIERNHNLLSLTISNCKNLTSFCCFDSKNLYSLEILHCPNLKDLYTIECGRAAIFKYINKPFKPAYEVDTTDEPSYM